MPLEGPDRTCRRYSTGKKERLFSAFAGMTTEDEGAAIERECILRNDVLLRLMVLFTADPAPVALQRLGARVRVEMLVPEEQIGA